MSIEDEPLLLKCGSMLLSKKSQSSNVVGPGIFGSLEEDNSKVLVGPVQFQGMANPPRPSNGFMEPSEWVALTGVFFIGWF